MSERKKIIKETAVVALALGAYYILVRLTGISVPCLFHMLTGLDCPGCGISRLLLHASKLEFAQAFGCNPVLFFMLPFFGALLVIKIIFMPQWLSKSSPIFNTIIIMCCVILVVYGVVRNLL